MKKDSTAKERRISKHELALRTGISRQSVAKYLAQEAAPKPDGRGQYDPVLAACYVGRCHQKGAEPDVFVAVRKRKAEIELAKLERTESFERQDMVAVSLIKPGITNFSNSVVHVFRREFEIRIPQQAARLIVKLVLEQRGAERSLFDRPEHFVHAVWDILLKTHIEAIDKAVGDLRSGQDRFMGEYKLPTFDWQAPARPEGVRVDPADGPPPDVDGAPKVETTS